MMEDVPSGNSQTWQEKSGLPGSEPTFNHQLGYIACQVERKLKWDPVAERFDGDEEANKLLCLPPGREPWTV